MTTLFGDTYYFLALLNAGDAAHAEALSWVDQIDHLVTTEWILTELADGLSRSRNRAMFYQTRRELLQDENVLVVPYDMLLFEEAIELYRDRSDKSWSLTDCVSFIVMRDRNISEALTGDRHFEQAGFKALLK